MKKSKIIISVLCAVAILAVSAAALAGASVQAPAEPDASAMRENLKAKLDKQVADGKITQEDADRMLEKFDGGAPAQFKFRDRKMDGSEEGGAFGHGFWLDMPDPSKYEGLTDEERADAIKEDIKAALDKQVAEGTITQEKADEILDGFANARSFGPPRLFQRGIAPEDKNADGEIGGKGGMAPFMPDGQMPGRPRRHSPDMQDRPDMKDLPDIQDRPELKEWPDKNGKPELKEWPDMENKPELKEWPDKQDKPDFRNKSGKPHMRGRSDTTEQGGGTEQIVPGSFRRFAPDMRMQPNNVA